MHTKDIKKIAIIGSGIVGQATGKGLADVGNSVIFYDTNQNTIKSLLDEGFEARHIDELNSSKRELDIFDFFMTSVPTPTQNGRINLNFLIEALQELGRYIKKSSNKPIVIVRSTVPPGTTENLAVAALEKSSGKKVGKDFGVCMNPEFLREVSAQEDFRHPWMVVIGSNDKRSTTELGKLYAPFDSPIEHMSIKEAEMMKYAHNLLNATKISFFNEMRMVSNGIGANPEAMFPVVVKSAEAIWNPKYGIKNLGAYDGMCLPKDTLAFYTWAAEALGYEMPVLKGTMQTNELMKLNHGYLNIAEKGKPKRAVTFNIPVAVAGLKKEIRDIKLTQKTRLKKVFN